MLGSFIRIGERYLYLTEVEAYGGSDDEASHAHRRHTPRNQVMFGDVGRLYVYFTYGMHHCLNVVTHCKDEPGAVLIRSGVGLLWADGRPRIEVILGPGRVGKYLGVTTNESGVDLLSNSELKLDVTPSLYGLGRDIDLSGSIHEHLGISEPLKICAGPRVGISKAMDKPWRFYFSNALLVSKFRAARQRSIE